MLSRLRSSSSNCYFHWCSGALASIRFQSTFSSVSNLGQSSTNNSANLRVLDPNQHNKPQIPLVQTVVGKLDINTFRRAAWIPETPLLLRAFHSLPAMNNWFQNSAGSSPVSFSPSMKPYEDTILPYEFTVSWSSDKPNPNDGVLTEYLNWLRESSEYRESYLPALIEAVTQSSDRAENPNNPSSFQQFDAPLSLIMSACQFNLTRNNSAERIKRIYVAQSSLSNLPQPLSRDLPTPDIVRHTGKGDIYSSSIWLGLQPTYTPLHRDPNPNLFCQLVGSKRIRLMTPDRGDEIYARVRRELGSHGSSRFRGPEMMGGRERELLHSAVWEGETVSEVSLSLGDALFIPTGWWHSVASDGTDGELNSSVNWWFR
ncbi:Clavaminate synthase-like protein [Hypoxylon cercidicola]|nr:Clavaminate synthase-like protein [Hypoxylon cercidicola]